MSDLLYRVRATIPGLVQPGSLSDCGRVDGVLVPEDQILWCVINGAETAVDSLDLNDRTSRVHAAWWVQAAIRVKALLLLVAEDQALYGALKGLDMTPEQIDTLARLVLRLAEEVTDE